MKTTLQNLKSRLFATGLAIITVAGIQAQCATSTTISNLGSGNISLMNQSTYTGGWDSYVVIDFGDGGSTSGTGTSFSNTHQYSSNGTYYVVSNLFAYNPMDSSFNCSGADYDTVVVNDIACSIAAGAINMQQGGGIYDWYFYSTVSSSQPVYQSDWVITDSIGNYLQSWSGTNGNSVSYTFPTAGYYNIGFSVMIYDSLTATYCSDSVYTSINIDDSLTPGCNLQAYVNVTSTGGNSAVISGYANNVYSASYIATEGQIYYNTDSLYHTFSGPGSYMVCYYVEDSTVATYCYDSACVIYTIAGPVQCNASFYMYEDSSNVGQWYAINNSVGSGAITYSWDFGDGSSSTLAYPSHTYATAGNYVICLTIADGLGCSSSSCDSSAAFRMTQQMSTNAIIGSITVMAPTVGVAETKSVLAETKVFPNPMTEISAVTFNSSLSASGKIEVVNVLGAVVMSENVLITKGNNEFKLNTAALANGVYYVNIVAENRVLNTVKAIK